MTFNIKSYDLSDFNNFTTGFTFSKLHKKDPILVKLFSTPEIRKIATEVVSKAKEEILKFNYPYFLIAAGRL